MVTIRRACIRAKGGKMDDENRNARDCAHGSLRRTCEVCRLDERIAELEAECERLRAVVLWYAEYGGTTAIENDYGKRARAALKGRG